ncbi:MAG: hypothetical protein HY897_07320 [Deltaproteobacteria bacterium]|nr:hypothetical protein [Deltaproteobacteria bacterium]
MTNSIGPHGGDTDASVQGAAAAMEVGDYRRAADLARPAALAGDPEARRVIEAVRVDPAAVWAGAATLALVIGYWLVVR